MAEPLPEHCSYSFRVGTALSTHHLFGTYAGQVDVSPPSTEEDTQGLKGEVACPVIPRVGADLVTVTVHRSGLSHLLPWFQVDLAIEWGNGEAGVMLRLGSLFIGGPPSLSEPRIPDVPSVWSQGQDRQESPCVGVKHSVGTAV